MATIGKRTRRDREIWVARIRRSRSGRKWSESRSFATEAEARAWATAREFEIDRLPDIADAALTSPTRNPTIGEAIDRYLALKRDLSKSKQAVLRRARKFRIAEIRCADLSAAAILEFATDKLDDGVQPQTVTRYLAELSAVLGFARVFWKVDVDRQAMADAWNMAVKLGIAGKSHRRDRRPTLKELDRLMAHFSMRRFTRPSSLPMDRIIAFAIFSTRRRGEICRMKWRDLDRRLSKILIRDMKNPGQTIGNNRLCELPPPALAIAMAQPRREGRIWPYDPDTITAAFRDACKRLNIRDLHFHDLRHEGISRLFEMGRNVPRVQDVSGHSNWQSLQRYTHLQSGGRARPFDKFEGWKWIEKVAKADWQLRSMK